jgi:hypothetical protein
VNALAALAVALAGIHVGTQRVMPVGYAPAWDPGGARIAFVTKNDLWVALRQRRSVGAVAPDLAEGLPDRAGAAQLPRDSKLLKPALRVPCAERGDEDCAGRHQQRLRGDAERDGLFRVDA